MGSRLWPLSRKSYPKQFVRLNHPLSFFQQAVNRVSSEQFEHPVVITNDLYRFIVKDQLNEIGIKQSHILIEPEPKSTAPAILAAAIQLTAKSSDACMLVMPSDHHIPDPDLFCSTIQEGLSTIAKGRLITWGSIPDSAETGYGYLELEEFPIDEPAPLKSFVEKPSLNIAKSMLGKGNFLWNMGIYLFRIVDIIAAFKKYSPDIYMGVMASMDAAWKDLDFIRIASDPWSKVKDISIDYAIMEKADNLSVIPYEGKWSDCGSWVSVGKDFNDDQNENSSSTVAIDCHNVMLRSEADGPIVVGIGLSDLAVVAMSDAVLVTDMKQTHKVRDAVNELTQRGFKQAIDFPLSHRPWGWSENLVSNDRFQVNRIVVKPGQAITMQSHQHRSEHWTVVVGSAEVTIDDSRFTVSENQSIFIPKGSQHRLQNTTSEQLEIIEVQSGTYLGDDDIQRFDTT